MSRRGSQPRTGHIPRCGRVLALLVAAALAVLVGSPGAASADGGRPQGNPEERAAAMIRPAVMYLAAQAYGRVRLPGGEMLSLFGEGSNIPTIATWTCTGFVVNPDGWVATAGHCVDPETATQLILKHSVSEFMTQFPDSPAARNPVAALDWLRKSAKVEGDTADRGPEIGLTLWYGTGTKIVAKMPADVVDFRPLGKGDVALLKVGGRNMPSSELAGDADVSIGTPILTVGFAETTQQVTGLSLDPTNKSGKVSKKATVQTNPVYEIDAAVTEGMSGGPTIDLNGKVIGVNSFGPVNEPQPFNFITPADSLAALLADNAVKPTLGPADVYYRKGLNNYYAGHYSGAIKDFDQALALFPDYPGLADLKSSAANLRQQYGDESVLHSSNLLWYVVSAVLLGLTVVGWVAVMMIRSRRQLRTETEAAQSISGVPPPPDVRQDADVEPGVRKPLSVVPEPQSSEPHFCANCGAEHHPDEKFCPNCGKRITLGESA